MSTASGHKIEEMEAQVREQYQKDFQGDVNDMVVLRPGGWLLPRNFLKFQDKVYNFKFRKEDVVIMTYPKCGTTWMQEIIWTMLNNPNLDNEEANLPLWARSPFLECDMFADDLFTSNNIEMVKGFLEKFKELCPGKNPADGLQIQLCEALPGRRAIKTHCPFSLLSPDLLSTAKIVFVARNPKDTCLSFQHHMKLVKGHDFVGSQDVFVEYFVNELLLYGSYGEMLKEAWAVRDHPNMHFTFYEDLKTDVDGELKKINDFIGAFLNEQQLKNVKDFTSFTSMQARDPVKTAGFVKEDVAKKEGGFIRKGQSGGWKGKITKEQETKIDDYVKRHFEGTGFSFKY